MTGTQLDAWLLQEMSCDRDRDVADVIRAIAGVALDLASLLSLGSLAVNLGAPLGAHHADGRPRRQLDVMAGEEFAKALRQTPAAFLASEERESVMMLNEGGRLAVTMKPLDGASTVDTNLAAGTIFSILPLDGQDDAPSADPILKPGTAQLAAGFVVYGPQTALVVSIGRGVEVFIADHASGAFRLAKADVVVPAAASEIAVDVSNRRHWDEAIRAYVDDCLEGEDGPLGENVSMRWIASLVAEAYRILMRGGVFLDPGDKRRGCRDGHLSLICEAHPIAFLMEQAGGAASDGAARLLDIRPTGLHQRTPLVFGSAEMVARVGRYHTEPMSLAEHSPLFGRRGLLRV